MPAALLIGALVGVAEPGGGPADAAIQPAAATANQRLLANAGFELSGTAPTSWSTSGAGTVTVVGDPVHSGTRAARVGDSSGTEGMGLRSAHITALPGEELTATAWANRVDGNGGSLYLEFWKSDGTRATATSVAPGAATGWQSVTVRGITPDDAVTATILAYSSQAEIGATIWDDAAVTALPPPQRRVPNAGFEELRDPSTPTEWTVDAPGGGTEAIFLKGAGTAHTGRGSLQTKDDKDDRQVSVLSRQVPVAAGETITASVWANPMRVSTGTLYLEFWNAAGQRIGTPSTVDVGGGTGWRQIQVTGVAPNGSTGLKIRLYSPLAGMGTIRWDDVSLRSSADRSYDPALTASSPVLFIGDQRVESYTGVSRVIRPGTKVGADGSVFAGIEEAWDKNPRVSGTVLRGGPGYQMWYTTSGGTGYAESTDGVSWRRRQPDRPVSAHTTGGVVANPAWSSGGTQPRYFMIRPGKKNVDPSWTYYYMMQSNDGFTWTAVPGAQRITGWDVANVTYDPVIRKFVAMTKQVPVDYDPPTVRPGPRTVWVSTSSDFKTWSTPQPSFATDLRDDELIPAGTGKLSMTPWSEVYGMPAIRYGDQYLGLPWIFNIGYSPNRDNGDPGPDKGRFHIGVASSRDLVNWSRPSRDKLITPGPVGSWDWGFHLTGTTFDTVLRDGRWETRLWYSSFAGEHVCDEADTKAGKCEVETGRSKIGLVTWPTDRFQSFRAAPGGGTVTTRSLTPAGGTLAVNFDPGTTGGSLTVEVLDANGNPIPGYGAADATAITSNALAPGSAVRWGPKTTLPTDRGPLRLRFNLTDGDLYAFSVN